MASFLNFSFRRTKKWVCGQFFFFFKKKTKSKYHVNELSTKWPMSLVHRIVSKCVLLCRNKKKEWKKRHFGHLLHQSFYNVRLLWQLITFKREEKTFFFLKFFFSFGCDVRTATISFLASFCFIFQFLFFNWTYYSFFKNIYIYQGQFRCYRT